jgi:hypothetical protein
MKPPYAWRGKTGTLMQKVTWLEIPNMTGMEYKSVAMSPSKIPKSIRH